MVINMCPTCDLEIICSFCERSCTYTREKCKNNLRVGDYFETYGCCIVKVLDIKENYIILCITKDILSVIRTFEFNSIIPLCFKDSCSNTSMQIKLLNISF